MATKKLILVVDDNRDTRFVFGALLDHDGYHVVEAENGARAVELARELQPDLILMDIQMPGMDGLEAARRIRAERQTPRPVIFCVSAHVLNGGEASLEPHLFDASFQKPMSPRAVLNEVLLRIGAPDA